MQYLFVSLCGWMPPPLLAICAGVVVMFFTLSIAKLIAFIEDIIPFI